MARIPESTKTSLHQRLQTHAQQHWPKLAQVHVRYRGNFAYVGGELPDGEQIPLIRLRYNGSASIWGFAIWLASKDNWEDSLLPTGLPAGTPQDALDCACGLYLSGP